MRIAIYSRKSKFTGKGESIENQINMCIKYAETVLGITDYEVFEDEGFSGKNTDRPMFQKLMKDIRNKKFTHFMCYRLDRAFRDVADHANSLKMFKEYNVHFISIKEQFDTTTASGRAMMNVSAAFAQFERETTAERIKDNLRELSKTGRWLGGPAPLGYESIEVKNNDSLGKSRKKHILKINEIEIQTVKLVFELFEKYKSFQKVSRILENGGIYSRKGSVFSRELVKQTLNNPVYVTADKNIMNYFKKCGCEIYGYENINSSNGIMPYNRRKSNGSFAPIQDWIISIGEHQGVVSSDTWIKCQNINKEIKERASNRQCTSQDALLSGLVVCSHCGSGMSPRQNKSTKYHYRYYSCNLKNKSAHRCDNNALNAYHGEDYVVTTLKNLTADEVIENYEHMKKKRYIKINNKNIIEQHEKEISNNKKTISSLVIKMAYLDNDPTLLEPVKYEIKKLNARNQELNLLIENLNLENGEIIDTYESLDEMLIRLENFKKFYDFTENFEDRKKLIQSLVKFITWDSETGLLDIVLVGSSKERPNKIALPLGDRSRRNGSC